MYEREAVLGRDASSVFPRESAAAAGAGADATKAALGALRFITETEVRERRVSVPKGVSAL